MASNQIIGNGTLSIRPNPPLLQVENPNRASRRVQGASAPSPRRQKRLFNAFMILLSSILAFGLWLNFRFVYQLTMAEEKRLFVSEYDTSSIVSKVGALENNKVQAESALALRSKGRKSEVAPSRETVAYVISVIKCGDHQTTPQGILDAATILKHSIHQTSIRADSKRYDASNTPRSKYDYETIALVHRQAEHCTKELEDVVGYKRLIVDSPVAISEIQGEYLRKNVHKEWCCGADEFIKLYAYNLTEYPLVVHLDVDFFMIRPMDHLYDAMLGQTTEQWDAVELANEEDRETLPNYMSDVEAAWTRDYPDILPGRIAAYQAGFIVLKPNPSVLTEYIDVIRKGDFVEGYEFLKNGWGGKGYGGFVGAMAMQGLVAYYYDIIRPQTSVELNPCRFNHMGIEVRYLPGGKNYNERMAKRKKTHGKCRNNKDSCEDCTATSLSNIYNIHLTGCRKPWTCPSKAYNIAFANGKGPLNPELNPQLTHVVKNIARRADYIDLNMVRFEHCMDIQTLWTSYRKDLEDKVYELTQDFNVLSARSGTFEPQWFLGYCNGVGDYAPITIYTSDSKDHMKEAWQNLDVS